MLWRRLEDNNPFGRGWRSPFSELENMRRDMERLSDLMQRRSPFQAFRSGVFPALNLTEDKDNYYVRAELPGIANADLDIQMTGNGLSISGERKIPAEDGNVKYHRRERESGKFSRIINLPKDVDSEKVEAKLTDGLLTIKVPKAETAKPRQITVG